MFAKKKVTLPQGRHKIVILDEVSQRGRTEESGTCLLNTRPTRPTRATRPARPTRPTRPTRPARPTRPTRPTRSTPWPTSRLGRHSAGGQHDDVCAAGSAPHDGKLLFHNTLRLGLQHLRCAAIWAAVWAAVWAAIWAGAS